MEILLIFFSKFEKVQLNSNPHTIIHIIRMKDL